ncbi:hypothetical protein [Pendulispora albinea]|uniref:Uncharacterized protein n=1 Tax=Pendulispora albinea TaxID=2741071 RepID=A0ABZ2LYS1_9BACT
MRSNASRTGALKLPARSGAVGIYTMSPPPGADDLGIVEVQARGDNSAVETLLPEFARRVAELGGNAAWIEQVSARFQIVSYMARGIGYTCGPRDACLGASATYPYPREIMVVSMRGHALRAPNQPDVPGKAASAPFEENP